VQAVPGLPKQDAERLLRRQSSQQLEIPNMALRVARGLFRLWLVLSVLWIGGVGYVTWQTVPTVLPTICDVPASERPWPARLVATAAEDRLNISPNTI